MILCRTEACNVARPVNRELTVEANVQLNESNGIELLHLF